MFRLLIIFGFLVAVICLAFYFIHFSVILGMEISNKTEDWAFFGTYIGGVLGSLLSFISIILLIRSLDLQRETNNKLENELLEEKKHKKFKLFESQFFNLLDVQREGLKNLELRFPIGNNQNAPILLKSHEAILELEDILCNFKNKKFTVEQINDAIDNFDYQDSAYSLLRMFSVIQKTIKNDLSDEREFTKEDRERFYTSLLNFTDFAQIRLVLILVKYSEHRHAKDILNNKELIEIFERDHLIQYFNDI